MDKIAYLLVISVILGLCVVQVAQALNANAEPKPNLRNEYTSSIPSGSGTSSSAYAHTVCANGKCEQVSTTCVNSVCTDKKSVTNGTGTSGQSSSQSKHTVCVNGVCEEVTTSCINNVCTDSKSNTIPNGFSSPPQQFDPSPPRNPNDGFDLINHFFDASTFQPLSAGNPNDVFGPINPYFDAPVFEPLPTQNLNDDFEHVFNNEQSGPIFNSGQFENQQQHTESKNQEEKTECINGVCKTVTKESKNQEKHTECINGICKTVTTTCNNGNCITTTQ